MSTSGTATVSGLASGIDWQTTISQLMTIERRPQDLLVSRKNDNDTKLSLWAQIQSKVQTLQSSMESMNQRSEFAVKSASSSDATIAAVSASASAATGAHTVEVLQLAKAHRIAAQGWADKNSTGVGDSGGNFVISVNGKTITIADADLSSTTTLEGLRNLINNSKDNDGLVTASIVDDGSSSGRYRLVLAADATGVDNKITVSTNPTNLDFQNTRIGSAETQSGWTGTSAVTAGGTYSGSINKSYTFTVAGSGDQTIGSADITLNWADSLGNTGTLTVPNAYSGGDIAVAEGVQLSFEAGTLTGGQSFSVDVYNPQLTAAQDATLSVDGIYMNKASNTVSDVLDGVTINLLAAKPGTVLDVSINNDTASVGNKIQNFVDSYNSLMTDMASFSAYDKKNKIAAPLLGDGFLSQIRSVLTSSVASAVSGLPANAMFDNLSAVGINAGSGGQLSIDSAKLDDALLNHFDDVVGLFTQNFQSDDSKISMVSSNQHSVSGHYALVVNYDATGKVSSATIDGKAATVDGGLIHGAKGTGAEGLVLALTNPGNGAGSLSTTFRFSQGATGTLAAQTALINDDTTGEIHFATDGLNKSSESLDRQISDWDSRLASTEERLRKEYTTLETLISQMKNQSSYISATLG